MTCHLYLEILQLIKYLNENQYGVQEGGISSHMIRYEHVNNYFFLIKDISERKLKEEVRKGNIHHHKKNL